MSECFWQVLHHADPRTCFGTGNPRNPPTIKSPISLIYACRSDDVLMREDIARWCDASKQGRLERCVLAVSGAGHNDALPFPDYSAPAAADGSSVSEDLSTLASLPNVATAEGRSKPRQLGSGESYLLTSVSSADIFRPPRGSQRLTL